MRIRTASVLSGGFFVRAVDMDCEKVKAGHSGPEQMVSGQAPGG